ncbi:CU044_2847 family protein [Streptomyces sp. NPDC003032]
MSGHVQRIELPGGKTVYARIGAVGGHGEDDEDVGVLDSAVAKVEELGELIRGVGGTVLDAAAAARPDEASVTFGVELSAKPGKVIAVLAEGEAKASVQVTLTWQLNGHAATPDVPPAAHGAAAPDVPPAVHGGANRANPTATPHPPAPPHA